MAEAAILERQKRIEESEKLNPRATQEIVALLEESEKAPVERETRNGGWYFRMASAGVRYYSF